MRYQFFRNVQDRMPVFQSDLFVQMVIDVIDCVCNNRPSAYVFDSRLKKKITLVEAVAILRKMERTI